MRELRGNFDAVVASRRHRPLPVQRLRTLSQDERYEPTADQAIQTTGKYQPLRTIVS